MRQANTVVGTITINGKTHQVTKRGDCKDSYFVRFKQTIIGGILKPGVVSEQDQFIPVGKNHASLPLVDYPVTPMAKLDISDSTPPVHMGSRITSGNIEEPAR